MSILNKLQKVIIDNIDNLSCPIYLNEPTESKPYPNEHACRLQNPDKYTSFVRQACKIKSDNKCIDFIYGIKNGKSELQAMRYKKKIWTTSAARKHCKDHDGTFEAAK